MSAVLTRTIMTRTTAGLRAVLLDEIDALRNGEVSESRAHAIARLANATISTIRLEMDADVHLREMGSYTTAEKGANLHPLNLAA